MNVIYFSTEKDGRAYKNKNSLEKDLLKYGYSAEIANTFYKELDQYQNDNLGGSGTINHDLMKMINSTDEIVAIFDRLRSNF